MYRIYLSIPVHVPRAFLLSRRKVVSENRGVSKQVTGEKLSTYLLPGPFVSITYPDIASNSGPATHACFQPKPSDTSCGCAAEKKVRRTASHLCRNTGNSTSTNALTPDR